jgi:hypothetical protein
VQLLLRGHVLIGNGIRKMQCMHTWQLRVGVWANVGMPILLRRWAILDRVGSDVFGYVQPLFRWSVRDGVGTDVVRRMLAVLSWKVLHSVWGCCCGHM